MSIINKNKLQMPFVLLVVSLLGFIPTNSIAQTFSTKSSATFPAPLGPARVVVGDFDNDDDGDILYQTGANSSVFRFARSNGDGTFTDQAIGSSPFASVTLVDHNGSNYHVADFDRDGDQDVWAGVTGTTGSYYRNDNGSFTTQNSSTFPAGSAARAVAGDFDKDGDADFLYQSGGNGTAFKYAKSNGNGTFTDIPFASSPFGGLGTLVDNIGANYYIADFDGDGDVDVWAGVNNTTGSYYRNDNGTFTSQSSASFPAPLGSNRAVVSDYDTDGDADILFQTGANGTAFQYARSIGNGTFTIVSQASSPFASVTLADLSGHYYIEDFDNDDDFDVWAAVASTTGSFYSKDDAPPSLVSFTPANNATGVSPSVNITYTFSESVVKGTGNITIVRTSDNTNAEVIPVVSSQVTGSGTNWTINPSITLKGSTQYAIKSDAGTFKNAAGTIFGGVSLSNVQSFTTAMTLDSVSVPAADTYKGGDNLNFSVTFSESVIVSTAGGTPSISLTIGSAVKKATYVSGSGTAVLVFRYTVSSGDFDDNGIVVGPAIVLNGGTIKNGSADANAPLTLNNVGSTAGVLVGGPPSVTINQAVTQDDPTNGSSIHFTAVFSQRVSGFTNSDVTLGGTADATTAVVSETAPMNGTTYDVAVSGMTHDGTVTASVAAGVATDEATNPNLASTSTDNSVTYDGTAPAVTVEQKAGQADPTNVSPINFTVVFSEVVNNFVTGDVTIGGTAGATTATVTGSGTTYIVAVSGMTSDGTVTVSLGAGVATDAAGNSNAASTSTDNEVSYDGTVPTVTVEQAEGQADPTGASPINFTVVFSESVTGFTNADVSLSGTAGPTTAVVSGSGTTYNVAVSGITGIGTVIASVEASASTDAAGNGNTASTSDDNTVTYDNSAPSVTINQASGQADPTNGSPINFTVVFSKPVSNFTSGDVTLNGTADATTTTVTGSGTTYNVAVSGMAHDGTVIASIDAGVATDDVGNNNTSSMSDDNTVTYDATAPTVTINQKVGQADPTNVNSVQFTVVFSEPVTDFFSNEITLSGPYSVGKTGSGTTYTVTVSGMTSDANITATINAGVAHDAAGNGNTASTSDDNTVTFDGTAPSVTINTAPGQNDPTGASPINFRVVFNEPVTGFDENDVTLNSTAGPVTATVTGTGTTYNVAVTGMNADGQVTASIGDGKATDLAGNGNTASTSTDNTVTFTTCAAPDITLGPSSQSVEKCSAAVSFSVTASGDGLHYQWKVDGLNVGSDQPILSYNPSSLTVGPHTVRVDITGTCGTDFATATLTISADSHQPQITCPVTGNANRNTATGICTYTVSGTEFNATATDNCSVTSLAYTLTGVTTGTGTTLAGKVFNKGVTTVTWRASDGVTTAVTCSFTVTVVDNQPPVITTIATPVVLLWSPNHKYQTVKASQFVSAVSDNCGSIPVGNVVITKVTSDEPDDAPGNADGNTTQDIKIATTCKTVDLRSERIEGGNGRVYTIYLKVTDSKGNVATATGKAIVAANQNGTTAIDNGPAYTVNSTCNTTAQSAPIVQSKQLEVSSALMLEASSLTLYPNPSNGRFIINLRLSSSSSMKAKIELINMLGQTVYTGNGNIADGKLQQTVALSPSLTHGMYIVKITANNKIYQEKLLYAK